MLSSGVNDKASATAPLITSIQGGISNLSAAVSLAQASTALHQTAVSFL
jgi:hypothetical protein